ncbi:MAG TPA: hypothetical protein VGH67_12490 [Solirubrobacteraceae bacterium]|jgi:hypothetical protein
MLMRTSQTRDRPRVSRAARATGVAIAGLIAGLIAAGPASAHLRSGTVAVDYRAGIASPVTSAYAAQIYQSDNGLSLTVKPGHMVELLGYLGEPVARLDAAGLWVNAASPTALAMRLVSRSRGVDASTPRWRLRRGRHTLVWHDARVQGLPSGVERGRWSIPLVIDGHHGGMEGELRRFADPSPWVWLALLVAWLALGAVAARRRRPDGIRAAAMGLAVIAAAAAGLAAGALALDAYASPGTWIEALDLIAFLAVGLVIMWRGPRNLHVAAAIWVGLVSLALGLLDGAVFLHPIVLAVLPGVVMRLLVTTALGAGLSAAVLGCTLFGEIAEAVRDHERVLARAAARPVAGASSTARLDEEPRES